MIESIFFGSDPRLFGSYHRPEGRSRDRAVLLVPPLGHEYVQCHAAYRMLAARLGGIGFPALRFDCRGLGNAEGALDALGLDDWIEDVERAVEELARLSGAVSFCVAGIGLGASLAALAAGVCPAIESVLLWDPVLEGQSYIASLKQRQDAFLRALPGGRRRIAQSACIEIFGFRLGARLVDGLEALKAADLAGCLSGKDVLLLEHGRDRLTETGRQGLAARCGRMAFRSVAAADDWREDPHKVHLPGAALDEIVAWVDAR